MLNVLKNETIWPEYIKLNLCNDFVNSLDNLIKPYKEQVSDAVIYSLVENKNIRSERRLSYKKSFHSVEIKTMLQKNVIPLIYSMLKSSYPDNLYDVSIGDQIFDYIKYNNGGYFDKHKDFVRIKSSQSKQYTVLIGLGSEGETYSWSENGNTVLWFPIDHINQYDYEILSNFAYSEETMQSTQLTLSNTNISQNVKDLCQKYGIGYIYSGDKIKTLFQQNQTNEKYMPYVFNINGRGKSLMFRSDIIHSGEPYYNVNRPKELFSFVINITGINQLTEQVDNQLTNQPTNQLFFEIAEPKTKNILYKAECIEDELPSDSIFEKIDKSINNSTNNPADSSNIMCGKFNEWLNDAKSNIIMFDNFEYWMIEWAKINKLVPWQIIVSKGSYNNKNFADTYIRYCNLDEDFVCELVDTNTESNTNTKYNTSILHKITTSFNNIYTKTKEKLNKRGRETHIESKIESTNLDVSNIDNLLNIRFNTDYIMELNKMVSGLDQLTNAKYNILNYAENFTQDLIKLNQTNQINQLNQTNQTIKYEEKVVNTWEESTCNDDGDEYDETTYLQCNINIKFCFCKLY